MKTFIFIIIIVILAFGAGYLFHKSEPNPTPQQLTLEQILSIKELHLVKHTYTDLFYLHRHNNLNKPIRAIVQIPVSITAYLNLKEIKLIHHHDSLKVIVLPHAQLNAPNYHIDQMIVRETRGLQVHIGKDLYPMVGNYLKDRVAERIDTLRKAAISAQILAQAEKEGKEYIEKLLHTLHRQDILVTFETSVTEKKNRWALLPFSDLSVRFVPLPQVGRKLEALVFIGVKTPQRCQTPNAVDSTR